MNLPHLSVVNIDLPFQIPQLVHPCMIHMVIALPVLIVLLEFVNIIVKKKSLGVLSFFFIVILGALVFFAYLSGSADASLASKTLDAQSRLLLDAHREIAVYLLYGSAILLLLKILSIIARGPVTRVVFFLFLLLFTATMLNNAKKGKTLVYEYGVNVKKGDIPIEAKEKREDTTISEKSENSGTPASKEHTIGDGNIEKEKNISLPAGDMNVSEEGNTSA